MSKVTNKVSQEYIKQKQYLESMMVERKKSSKINQTKNQEQSSVLKQINFNVNQMTKIQELQNHLMQLQSNPDKFIVISLFKDDLFQNNISCICKKDSDFKKDQINKIEFLRLSEIIPNIDLIHKQLDLTDIKQGALGDCYFLSSLSVLTEKPFLINRLFEIKVQNAQGIYCVWLCIDGEWKAILIDDYIPCINKQPWFSKIQNNQVWVILLEKAYAKAYGISNIVGNYENIELGIPSDAIRDLTGAPYEMIDHENQKPEKIWQEIYNNLKKGYLINCVSESKSSGQKKIQGIQMQHAYSILDARKVQTKKQIYHLIKLRNPWGLQEWNGLWSDKSDIWTPELAKQLNKPTKNDGIFWMDVLFQLRLKIMQNYMNTLVLVKQRKTISILFKNMIFLRVIYRLLDFKQNLLQVDLFQLHSVVKNISNILMINMIIHL